MLTHSSLVEACKNLHLDSTIQGKNFYASARPLEGFENPFDLSSINFPETERAEVEKIGVLIHNLYSQIKFPRVYFGKEGMREHARDTMIEKFLPTAIEAMDFWFKKGLKVCKVDRKEFTLYYGVIYEVDPEYQISMERMNAAMKKVREEYIVKSARSERSASRIILR